MSLASATSSRRFRTRTRGPAKPTPASPPPAFSVPLPRAGLYDAVLDLSLVIPIFNEEENLNPLYQRVGSVLDSLERSYELIFVDDGSTDGSASIMAQLQANDPHVRLLRFRRNYGQTAAIAAGFAAASGAAIVTLDGDLQNDPDDIPTLLAALDAGWDIASGWRADRQDPFLTRTLPSRMANGLISRIAGLSLHDHGCTLKAYRADLAKSLRLYGEMHRFIPAVATGLGATVIEIPVQHHPRHAGRSKYGLSRIFKVFLDLILLKFLLTYASRPLRVFGVAGLLAASMGVLIGFYLSAEKLIANQAIGGRPLLVLSTLLVIFGVQLISMGLLGEVLVRIYHEAQEKPIYTLRERLGWSVHGDTATNGVVHADQYIGDATEPLVAGTGDDPSRGTNGVRPADADLTHVH